MVAENRTTGKLCLLYSTVKRDRRNTQSRHDRRSYGPLDSSLFQVLQSGIQYFFNPLQFRPPQIQHGVEA